jgi:hypothetical protein
MNVKIGLMLLNTMVSFVEITKTSHKYYLDSSKWKNIRFFWGNFRHILAPMNLIKGHIYAIVIGSQEMLGGCKMNIVVTTYSTHCLHE